MEEQESERERKREGKRETHGRREMNPRGCTRASPTCQEGGKEEVSLKSAVFPDRQML